MKKIAILASGSGTNAEAIAIHLMGHSSLQVDLIASNKADAFVLERAENLGIKSGIFSKKTLNDGSFLEMLKKNKIDYIVLAGFLLKVPLNLIKAYPEAIINIHPALLPSYGGKGMYGDKVHQTVIDNKETESGISIHYVNEHFDEGEIIFQAKCEISKSDTPDDLAAKIHKLEHKYFPEIVEKLWG
jgi:phosphoribosylglycinamide formyltransferase 1